jgi:hypothetical protein
MRRWCSAGSRTRTGSSSAAVSISSMSCRAIPARSRVGASGSGQKDWRRCWLRRSRLGWRAAPCGPRAWSGSASTPGSVRNFVWGRYDDLEGDIAWHAARNPAFPTTCLITGCIIISIRRIRPATAASAMPRCVTSKGADNRVILSQAPNKNRSPGSGSRFPYRGIISRDSVMPSP